MEGSAVRVGRELLPCLNVNVQLFLPPFLQESCYVKSIKLTGLWRGFEVFPLSTWATPLWGCLPLCFPPLEPDMARVSFLPILQTGRKDSLASTVPPNIAF